MGRNQGIDDAVILDLGHAAAVLYEVARGDAGDDSQFFGSILLPKFLANSLQNAVWRGKCAKAADANGHTIVDQIHGLGN